MQPYIIAFDIGGTRIKYSVASKDGSVVESSTIQSQANVGVDALYKNICKVIDASIEKYSGEMLGIGLGLTGCVDPGKGVVLLPGKFKSLEGFPIVAMLEEKYNTTVLADNDGRLAAYAEKYFGAAKDKKWAVVVTIGTGVGSGVILDGHILHDPHLQFGTQLGHIIIDKSNDRLCLTGNEGTGETLCSCNALALQVKDAIQRGIPSSLTDEYFKNPLNIDFEKVLNACRSGDKLCLRELDVWIKNLSVLLINAVHAYAPECIILSGGATLASDLFLDKVAEIVNRQVFRFPKGKPVEIIISTLQEYAGVMGAAAIIIEKLKIIASDDRVAKVDLEPNWSIR